MTSKWIVFDLIGVLAEPSWRDLEADPDLELWGAFKTGKTSEAEFWQNEKLAAIYRTMLRFRPDRLKLATSLKERGYHICIATNFSADWYKTLEDQLDDRSLFSERVISSEIGVAKPDKGFWDKLLEKVPTGSVFIDDRKDNCEAARNAGLRAIWAYPGAPLQEHLDSLLD